MHESLQVGLPILTVIIAAVWNNSHADKVEQRMMGQIGRLDGRLNALEARMDAGFQSINNRLDHLLEVAGSHEGRVQTLEKKAGLR
jgi:hypothetical protein